MMKSIFSFILLSIITPLVLHAETFKLPAEIKQIIEDKNNTDKAKTRINVANKIKLNLKRVGENSIPMGNSTLKNYVIVISEYLCPHCHNFLKEIKNLPLEKNDFHLKLLALPIFGTTLSKEYGVIFQQAAKENPQSFVEILAVYTRNNKEALLQLMHDQYKIDISNDLLSNPQSFEEHEKLLQDLGVSFVPMLFLVIDDKVGNNVVVPVMNVNPKRLIKVARELEKIDEKTIQYLKDELDQ